MDNKETCDNLASMLEVVFSPESIKVELVSDFRDWYDYMFGSPGSGDYVFRRMSNAPDPSRREIFRRLKGMDLQIPVVGTAQYIFDMGFNDLVVVYENEMSHRGDGKRLVDIKALSRNRQALCATWIPSKRVGKPESIRYLRIGNEVYWMRYSSDDEWRSNCGSVDITPIDKPTNLPRHFSVDPHECEPYPLLAIDFVEANSSSLYAVDYNIAPGVPKELGLRAPEIVANIKQWIYKHRMFADVYKQLYANDRRKL